MKNNKVNWYLTLGLLINAVVLCMDRLIKLPEAVSCFGHGMAIVLMLVGIFASRHDMRKIREFKRDLVMKLVKQRG